MKDSKNFALIIGAAIIGFLLAGNGGAIVLGLIAVMITPSGNK